MTALVYEAKDKTYIDYGDDTFGTYDNRNVIINKKKTFGFNSSTQQWLENEVANINIDEQIDVMSVVGKQRIFIPQQWSVESKSNGIVGVSLKLTMVNIVDGDIESIQEKEWLTECDFANGIVQAWPIAMLRDRRKGWVGTFTCTASVMFPDMLGASYIEVPAVVTDTAISYMQEMAEEEFGFRPSYMGSVHGIKHMIGYCKRPLDMNINQFRYLAGEQYEQLFPRDQRDNFRPLCHFFQIAHPPKSLRKIYGESPESIVAFLLFRQLGFNDINVIRRFFHREKLFGWHLMEMRYKQDESKLVNGRYDYEEYLEWLERFCHWYLGYRKETSLANCLHPLAVTNQWPQYVIDILRMFTVANIDVDDAVLPMDVKRRILREGFTPDVHDLMMEEFPELIPRRHGLFLDQDIPQAPIQNTVIKYTKAELKYSDELDGYKILLPKDTDELRKYGKAFHNCVASYYESVLEKRTLILAMKKGKKYIACLEIRQNRMVQALGPCNQPLSTEIGEVLCRWADKKKIAYRVRQR